MWYFTVRLLFIQTCVKYRTTQKQAVQTLPESKSFICTTWMSSAIRSTDGTVRVHSAAYLTKFFIC